MLFFNAKAKRREEDLQEMHKALKDARAREAAVRLALLQAENRIDELRLTIKGLKADIARLRGETYNSYGFGDVRGASGSQRRAFASESASPAPAAASQSSSFDPITAALIYELGRENGPANHHHQSSDDDCRNTGIVSGGGGDYTGGGASSSWGGSESTTTVSSYGSGDSSDSGGGSSDSSSSDSGSSGGGD